MTYVKYLKCRFEFYEEVSKGNHTFTSIEKVLKTRNKAIRNATERTETSR